MAQGVSVVLLERRVRELTNLHEGDEVLLRIKELPRHRRGIARFANLTPLSPRHSWAQRRKSIEKLGGLRLTWNSRIAPIVNELQRFVEARVVSELVQSTSSMENKVLFVQLKSAPMGPQGAGPRGVSVQDQFVDLLRTRFDVVDNSMGRIGAQGMALKQSPRSNEPPRDRTLTIEQDEVLGLLRVVGKVDDHELKSLLKDRNDLFEFAVDGDAPIFELPRPMSVDVGATPTYSPEVVRDKILQHLSKESKGSSAPPQPVRVGVIDSGLSSTVANGAEFASRNVVFRDFTLHPVQGYIDRDSDGHGTGVTCILAGSQHGIARTAEVAVACIFYPDQNGRMVSTFSIMREAIDWLLNGAFPGKRPHVVNMSLSAIDQNGDPQSLKSYRSIAERLAEKDVIVFASIGNGITKSACGLHGSPADSDQVNAVGAVDRFGKLADFSCHAHGAAPPPRHFANFLPEFVAVGVEVGTLDSSGNMVGRTGTSFATPIVAGAAALMRASSGEVDATKLLSPPFDKKKFGKPPHAGESIVVK